MPTFLPEFHAACVEAVNIRIKQNIYMCVYVGNYIYTICRIKICIWIQTDIGAWAYIFAVVEQSSASCLAIKRLTLPPPWPSPPQPLAFSKVISTSVFPGPGGRLWGLSVRSCARQYHCSLLPQDKVQRKTSGCVLS